MASIESYVDREWLQTLLPSKTEQRLAKDTVQVILQDGRVIVVRSFPSIHWVIITSEHRGS